MTASGVGGFAPGQSAVMRRSPCTAGARGVKLNYPIWAPVISVFVRKKHEEPLHVDLGTADPRLQMAFDLTVQYRHIQLGVLGSLRDRSLAVLEIVFLGASIIFAFGASTRGNLRPWMVILLLIGVGYNLAATAWIMRYGNWNAVSDWDVLVEAKNAKCACKAKSIDDCIEEFLKDGKVGLDENGDLLKRRRMIFESQFGVIAVLAALAVVFWVTLGS
jgi:hypothetical protein